MANRWGCPSDGFTADASDQPVEKLQAAVKQLLSNPSEEHQSGSHGLVGVKSRCHSLTPASAFGSSGSTRTTTRLPSNISIQIRSPTGSNINTGCVFQ